MTAFRLGQRVRTTVDALADREDAFSAPTGTLGTISALPSDVSGYSVILDGDPNRLPCEYFEHELAAA